MRALKKVLKKVLKKYSCARVLKKVLKKQYKNHKTQKSTFETYSTSTLDQYLKKNVLFLHFYLAVLLFLLPLAQFSEHFEWTFMRQIAKLSRPASIGWVALSSFVVSDGDISSYTHYIII